MTDRTCIIDDCDSTPSGRGMCQRHRRQALDAQRVLDGDVCSHDDCGRARFSKGFCNIHYHRNRNGLPMDSVRIRYTKDPGTCVVHGCEKPASSRRMCHKHYVRVLRHGTAGDVMRRERGENNLCEIQNCPSRCEDDGLCAPHCADLASGAQLVRHSRRRLGTGGYVVVHIAAGDERRAADGRAYAEHRLVLEDKLGRRLLRDESAHHVDGNRMNNAPENLELWVTMQPAGQRATDLVAYALRILERYGSEPRGI